MANVLGGIFGLMFFALNVLGPILMGIWLGILGEWSLLAMGIGYMVIGSLIVSILMLPGIALAAGAASVGNGQNVFLISIAALAAILWTYAVAIGSCAAVLSYSTGFVGFRDNPIPYVVWGATVAVAPWAFIAAKEMQQDRSNWAAPLVAFFINISVIFAGVWYLLDPFDGLIVWAGKITMVMGIGLMVQGFITLAGGMGSMRGAR